MEARIAHLESDVAHLRTDVADIKIDLRSLRDKIDGLTDSLASTKVWALLLYVALAATLLATMASGFGWL
jgi:hypothetical protein